MRSAVVALLVFTAVAAPAVASPGQRTGETAEPAILQRTPAELPRAAPGRWDGLFDPARRDELLASLAGGSLERQERGELAYRRRDYPGALRSLYELLEQEPDFPPALLAAGTTYFRLRRYGDVITCFERLLEVAPDQAWRTQALAHAYYSLGDYGQALRHYELVLADLPDSVEAVRGLALTYMRLGDNVRALALLERVFELRPEHGEAWAWRAQILYDEGLTEEALVAAERARELLPFDPRPWYLCSQILFELGRDDEAVEVEARWRELDRVAQELRVVEGQLDLHPRSYGLAVRLVELERSIGDVDGVREGFGLMLALRPPDVAEVDLRISMLDVLVELGDLEGARLAAQALEESCPGEAAAWRRLEAYYALLKDRKNQVRAGERYLRMATGDGR